jgi:alkylation response protein AidB-like acyl-CoA dehydrogenase
MDFELTEEQVALQRVMRELVDDGCPPSLVRSVAEGRDGAAEATEALWKTLVGMDLTGLTVPPSAGGSGATAVELVIVLEELGRGADPTPFLSTTSAYVPLVRGAFGDGGGDLLSAVCSGSTGAAALLNGPTGSTGSTGELRASAEGDGWRLTGTTRHVMDADRVDELAVVASVGGSVGSGEDLGVFVLPTREVVVSRTPSFDATVHVCEVCVDGVVVTAERSAVGPGVAEAVERATQEVVTGIAAVTVGACERILDMALDHVRSRHQFGVPIGSFQAVKTLAVDMFVSIQRARVLTEFAALAIAEDDPRRAVAPSMAKVAAGDAQRLAARHGVQLFGGLGYTWENDLQLFVRRAMAGELLGGTSREHRARVAGAALDATAPDPAAADPAVVGVSA